MVISIIVMLILAGVSISAIVGEDGIITKAQDATYLQSCAILEEFLNESFSTKQIDSITEGSNIRIIDFLNDPSLRKYLQRSSNGEYYFYDGEFKKFYLIEKSMLPDDIKNAIAGGETSETGTGLFSEFKDVYGITTDLRVYYCKSGLTSVIGANASEGASAENLQTEVFDSTDDWTAILDYDRNVTYQDIRSEKSITINKNNIDLTKLSLFVNLENITFVNCTYDNLDGLQYAPNLKFVYFKSCVINDYSQLKNVSKLTYLYLWRTTDGELQKLCSIDKGIGEYDIPTLRYFSVSNTQDQRSICSTWCEYYTKNSPLSNLTSLEPLRNLSTVTKESITYMSLEDNEFIDLSPISDFKNLVLLRANNNKIRNLNGLENLKSLKYLIAYNNSFGQGDISTVYSMSNDPIFPLSYLNTNLFYVHLANNQYLRWINIFENMSKITYLNLESCNALVNDSVMTAQKILNDTGEKVEPKYQRIIADETSTILNLSGLDVTIEELSSIGNYKNLRTLLLNNVKVNGSANNTSNENVVTALNNSLSQLSNLTRLELVNFKGYNDISKIKNCTSINTLDLRGTAANTSNDSTGLQILDDSKYSSLSVMIVNGDNIDLTKLQNLMNRMGADIVSENSGLSTHRGLLCLNAKSLKTLENCTNVERVFWGAQNIGGLRIGIDLDLTRCTKLKYITLHHVYLNSVKMPSSVLGLSTVVGGSTSIDMSLCNNLEFLQIDAYSNRSKMLTTMTNKTKLKTLVIETTDCINEMFVNNLDTIATMQNLESIILSSSSWNGSQITINTIGDLSKLSGLNNLKYFTMKNIALKDKRWDLLGNMPNLTYVDLTNTNCSNIEFAENMPNLEKLSLPNNKVNEGIYKLSGLSKLWYLNLNTNALSAIETHDGINYNILDILANMNYKKNPNMSLKQLFIDGNRTLPSDLSKISTLQWESKSGF